MFFITYKMSACQHAQQTWLAWYIGLNIGLLVWFINLSTLTFSWEHWHARPHWTISMIMCSRLAWQMFLFASGFFLKKKTKTLLTWCFWVCWWTATLRRNKAAWCREVTPPVLLLKNVVMITFIIKNEAHKTNAWYLLGPSDRPAVVKDTAARRKKEEMSGAVRS